MHDDAGIINREIASDGEIQKYTHHIITCNKPSISCAISCQDCQGSCALLGGPYVNAFYMIYEAREYSVPFRSTDACLSCSSSTHSVRQCYT